MAKDHCDINMDEEVLHKAGKVDYIGLGPVSMKAIQRSHFTHQQLIDAKAAVARMIASDKKH